MFRKIILFVLAASLIVELLSLRVLAEKEKVEKKVGTIAGKVIAKSKYRENMVVSIKEIAGKFPSPKKQTHMDQVKLVFVPHVLPILEGTTVEFLNSDAEKHNVFSPDYEEYDLGTWTKKEAARTYTFEFKLTKSEQKKLEKLKEELAKQPENEELKKKLKKFEEKLEEKKKGLRAYVQLCNVHPEMEAFIVVLPNPYFALSDKEGEFLIENIPVGKYILATWSEHRKIKPQEQLVEIESGKVTKVEFDFEEKKKK